MHQLHGADSRVAEVIFDPVGRQVATTRVAPGSFGSGAGQPVLQYRSVTTALESVQKAATRPEAYLCYGVAAFFVVGGFSVWGADARFGHGAT